MSEIANAEPARNGDGGRLFRAAAADSTLDRLSSVFDINHLAGGGIDADLRGLDLTRLRDGRTSRTWIRRDRNEQSRRRGGRFPTATVAGARLEHSPNAAAAISRHNAARAATPTSQTSSSPSVALYDRPASPVM